MTDPVTLAIALDPSTGAAVVRVAGPLPRSSVDVVRQAVRRAAAVAHGKVRVDLAACPRLDPVVGAGIGLEGARLRARGGSLDLVGTAGLFVEVLPRPWSLPTAPSAATGGLPTMPSSELRRQIEVVGRWRAEALERLEHRVAAQLLELLVAERRRRAVPCPPRSPRGRPSAPSSVPPGTRPVPAPR